MVDLSLSLLLDVLHGLPLDSRRTVPYCYDQRLALRMEVAICLKAVPCQKGNALLRRNHIKAYWTKNGLAVNLCFLRVIQICRTALHRSLDSVGSSGFRLVRTLPRFHLGLACVLA
jgi:hypothetical protein